MTASDWELVAEVTERLEAAGVPTPQVDARLLVEEAVERFGGVEGCDLAVLDGMVERRAAREPLQLVVGHTTFRWVQIACRAGVFVPRPETEVVAGLAIEAALAAGKQPRVVEPCTGTGAIACAVLSEVPGVELVAADVSEEAVELARENLVGVLTGSAPSPWEPGPWPAPWVSAKVRQGELLDALPGEWEASVDVLVSNPPYLPASDRGSWQPEVTDHDPDESLVGGEDGHEVVDELLALATTWLRPGGTVILEIDERRGADAVATAAGCGLGDVTVEQDLTGRDRALVARRPGPQAC